jgi:hypothetical protein
MIGGGWWFPGAAAKAHYFPNGGDGSVDTSLCGKWMSFGAPVDANADSPPSKSDCVACTRKLDALKAKL